MKWIDCKKQLPEKSGTYLVCSVYKNASYANALNYSSKHKVFNAMDWEDEPQYAMHPDYWMPFPKMPKFKEVAKDA